MPDKDSTQPSLFDTPAADALPGGGLSFEAAVTALEAMVGQLENDELPLEQAMQTFERSQALIRQCQQQLAGAEARVQVLVRQLEADGFGYELESFEDDEDEDEEA